MVKDTVIIKLILLISDQIYKLIKYLFLYN